MFHDYKLAILHYFVFSLFSLIGLAFTLRFTKKYNFLGYIISKPLGLLVFAYPIWLLASLKIIKFSNQPLLFFLFFIAIFLSLISIYKFVKKNTGKLNKKFLIKILLVEVLSLVLYLGYLYIRGFNAKIEGTERFMDMLMYMSAGKTDYFPFFDPWSPLKPVNYYYYGFYVFALITRLSGVSYAFAYNFSLAIILVCTFTITLAIVFRVTKSLIFSLLGAGLLSFAGNLHYAICYFKNMHAKDLTSVCYYPKATRILEPALTINEFPGYSFILGDMHPHVMVLPFFLTGIFLLFLIYKAKKANPYLLGSFILVLASAFMINTWDFITLGFIFGCIILGKAWGKYRENKNQEPKVSKFQAPSSKLQVPKKKKAKKENYIKTKYAQLLEILHTNKFLTKFKYWIIWSLIAVVSTFVLFFPFFRHFKSPVTSIGFGPEFVLWHDKDLRDVSVFQKIKNYGKLFVYSNLDDNGIQRRCTDRNSTDCKIAMLARNYQYPSSFSFLFGIYGFFVIITFLGIYTLVLRKFSLKKLAFPTLLFVTGIVLVGVTETIFFGDLFHITNPPYFRANTVFKFGYHAWLLMNLAFVIVLFFLWKAIGKIKNVVGGVAADITLITSIIGFSYIMFIFPVIGFTQAFGPMMPGGIRPVSADHVPQITPAETGTEKKIKKDWTLDGNYYIKTQNPEDWETIQWINKNQKERVVIVEAAGGAYTYFGRIGVNTGMGNPINWSTHEWTWRFHYPSHIKSWKEFILKQEYLDAHENERLQEYQLPKEVRCSEDFKDKNDLDSGYRMPGCVIEEVKEIYESPDIEATKKILEKYNVQYIYIGSQERVTYPNINEEKLNQLGQEVFRSGSSRLIEVSKSSVYSK